MRYRPIPLRLVPPIHRAAHGIGLFLQAAGLAVAQGEAHVLAHLAESGPCSITLVHRAFAHRRSTLTSILDRLEARGLVRREMHPHDRRSFLVRPTARGRALARRVHTALAALEEEALASIDEGERAGFEAVVTALETAAKHRPGRV